METETVCKRFVNDRWNRPEASLGRPKSEKGQREAIVHATLNCFHQFGYEGTTVARICAETGLSAGNIHYYFGGKQKLLEEAMRMLLRDVRGKMVVSLGQAQTPLDRVNAIVESNLHPDLFTQKICITWLHFWAQAAHVPELSRLEKINRRRFRQNLLHALEQICTQAQAELLTSQIVAMIDGFWIERAQVNSDVTSESAIFTVTELLQNTQFG